MKRYRYKMQSYRRRCRGASRANTVPKSVAAPWADTSWDEEQRKAALQWAGALGPLDIKSLGEPKVRHPVEVVELGTCLQGM